MVSVLNRKMPIAFSKPLHAYTQKTNSKALVSALHFAKKLQSGTVAQYRRKVKKGKVQLLQSGYQRNKPDANLLQAIPASLLHPVLSLKTLRSLVFMFPL